MFKFLSYPVLLLVALMIMSHTTPSITVLLEGVKNAPGNKAAVFLNIVKAGSYAAWKLDKTGLSENAFNYAMKGFRYLSGTSQLTKNNIVTIVDFSKPSSQKRLYVIDISRGIILFQTWVAHGHNSGDKYANKFSNSPESHQTSLGFYITMDTYNGGNGYSLRLKGCEKGINDNAYERDIVIHGADYVGSRFINSRGESGRSYGCPAVPADMSKKIIDAIKDGSCLFLYHPTKKYCSRSKILNSQV